MGGVVTAGWHRSNLSSRDNRPMPADTRHRRLAAHPLQVPRPFRRLAVRSDEPRHATAARAPYAWVHVVRTSFLQGQALAGIVAQGLSRVQLATFSDIDYAVTSAHDLALAAPQLPGLVGHIAQALQETGVLGQALAPYQASIATRIDYLAAQGAGFHNDVNGHWSRCLFWLLTLQAADVEFVMPHAGLRLPLAPGDLLVFDQTLAHGLCRPADQGQAVASSFEGGAHGQQLFLTGELPLSDAQWAALGAPWLPVEEHHHQGALDLMVAEFDERSGTIKRLHALRDGMLRSTCHVDSVEGVDGDNSPGATPA